MVSVQERARTHTHTQILTMAGVPPLAALPSAGWQPDAELPAVGGEEWMLKNWKVGTLLDDACYAVVYARDRAPDGVQSEEEVRAALLQAHEALTANTHSAESMAATTPPRCVAIVTSGCCRGGGVHAPPCRRCALVIAASERPFDQPQPNVVGMYAVDLEDTVDHTTSAPRPLIPSLPSWHSSTWDVVCNLAHTWFRGS